MKIYSGDDDGSEDIRAAGIATKKKKSGRRGKKTVTALQNISEEEVLELERNFDSDDDNDDSTVDTDDDTATLSRDTSQTSDASLVTHAEILLPDGRPKGVRVKSKGGNKKKNKVKNKSDEVAPSEGGTRGGGDKKGKKANRRELEQRQARREKAENLKKRYEKEQENLARERGQIVDDGRDSVESVRFYDAKTEKLKQEYSSKGLNLVFVDPFSVDTPPPVPASAPNVHIVTLTLR